MRILQVMTSEQEHHKEDWKTGEERYRKLMRLRGKFEDEKENDLTEVDLTKMLGIFPGDVTEIINGKRDLTSSEIPVLAEYFQSKCDFIWVCQ